MLANSRDIRGTIKSFKKNSKANIAPSTIEAFNEFTADYLNPKYVSYREIKKLAKRKTMLLSYVVVIKYGIQQHIMLIRFTICVLHQKKNELHMRQASAGHMYQITIK